MADETKSEGRREPLAFEVPVVPGGESLIKRHPPKKFQKLEEQQPDAANITPEQLEEKQAIAERRRKEILSQRIKSAKTTSSRSAQARARAAESKEVDQEGDSVIESAQYINNDQAGM